LSVEGRVRVLLIGILAEAVGRHIEEVVITSEKCVREVIAELEAKYPRLKRVVEELPLINAFINGRVAGLDDIVKSGDELVLAPPFYEGG